MVIAYMNLSIEGPWIEVVGRLQMTPSSSSSSSSSSS